MRRNSQKKIRRKYRKYKKRTYKGEICHETRLKNNEGKELERKKCKKIKDKIRRQRRRKISVERRLGKIKNEEVENAKE